MFSRYEKKLMMLWWFLVFSSFLNALIVFVIIITDNVTWITWFNGVAAIWLSLLAGPYPEKQKSEE